VSEIADAPNAAQTLLERGRALGAVGRHAEALDALDQALRLQPGLVPAHEARAEALMGLGRPKDSLAAIEEILGLEPGRGVAWSYRGALLQLLGRTDEALVSFDRAIELDPQFLEAHVSRGMVLDDLERFEESVVAWSSAAAVRPDLPDPRGRLAFALGRCGRHEEELAALDAALALGSQDFLVRKNRGLCLLQLGRYEEAWPVFELRKVEHPERYPPLRGAPWTGGAPVEGRNRIYVFHEEGAGDGIQFSRFLPELTRRGFEVSVWTLDFLDALLRTLPDAARMRFVPGEPEDYDLQCGMLSLPYLLGVTIDDLPGPIPYLQVDPARRARFAARLGPKVRPRIGLAWSGNPDHPDDANRSMPFARLAPLFNFDADWFALQKGVRASDLDAFGASGQVSLHTAELTDFADTAALADLMDLVITVDTSIAHLAGALAKPVWVMLPCDADWRWLVRREDSPWYPTARLFRQTFRRDWEGVVSRIAGALRRGPLG
jgi:tetratricopeptide (TPR) repeat protein